MKEPILQSQYLGAEIENYNYHVFGQKPDLDTVPDIFFGIKPQIQPDESLLTGETEISVYTKLVVECEEGEPINHTWMGTGDYSFVALTDTDGAAKQGYQTNDTLLVATNNLSKPPFQYGKGGTWVYNYNATQTTVPMKKSVID